jgi:hypothetical protein
MSPRGPPQPFTRGGHSPAPVVLSVTKSSIPDQQHRVSALPYCYYGARQFQCARREAEGADLLMTA